MDWNVASWLQYEMICGDKQDGTFIPIPYSLRFDARDGVGDVGLSAKFFNTGKFQGENHSLLAFQKFIKNAK